MAGRSSGQRPAKGAPGARRPGRVPPPMRTSKCVLVLPTSRTTTPRCRRRGRPRWPPRSRRGEPGERLSPARGWPGVERVARPSSQKAAPTTTVGSTKARW
jgi:hypothetical protein